MITVALAGFALLAQTSVGAASPTLQRFAVYSELGFAPGGGGTRKSPGWIELGVGAGYTLSERFVAKLATTGANTGTRLVRARDGGTEQFDTSVGALAHLLVDARFGTPRFAGVLGAGATTTFGGNFGVVALGDLEGGIEWRADNGFYLQTVVRILVPLQTSQDEISADRCFTMDCPSRFTLGHPLGSSRIAVGYAF